MPAEVFVETFLPEAKVQSLDPAIALADSFAVDGETPTGGGYRLKSVEEGQPVAGNSDFNVRKAHCGSLS